MFSRVYIGIIVRRGECTAAVERKRDKGLIKFRTTTTSLRAALTKTLKRAIYSRPLKLKSRKPRARSTTSLFSGSGRDCWDSTVF